MGSTRAGRLHKFTVPRKWAWILDETDEPIVYRRIGNVFSFNSTSEETLDWEELARDWDDDLGEAGER